MTAILQKHHICVINNIRGDKVLFDNSLRLIGIEKLDEKTVEQTSLGKLGKHTFTWGKLVNTTIIILGNTFGMYSKSSLNRGVILEDSLTSYEFIINEIKWLSQHAGNGNKLICTLGRIDLVPFLFKFNTDFKTNKDYRFYFPTHDSVGKEEVKMFKEFRDGPYKDFITNHCVSAHLENNILFSHSTIVSSFIQEYHLTNIQDMNKFFKNKINSKYHFELDRFLNLQDIKTSSSPFVSVKSVQSPSHYIYYDYNSITTFAQKPFDIYVTANIPTQFIKNNSFATGFKYLKNSDIMSYKDSGKDFYYVHTTASDVYCTLDSNINRLRIPQVLMFTLEQQPIEKYLLLISVDVISISGPKVREYVKKRCPVPVLHQPK